MKSGFLFRRGLMLRDVITTIQKLVNNGTLALESNSIGTMTVSNYTLSDNLTKPLEKITDLKETFFYLIV